jgi:hypothetical protein
VLEAEAGYGNRLRGWLRRGCSAGRAHWQWLCLLPLGLASQFLYLEFFLKPYPLLALYHVPLLDMGKVSHYSHTAGRDFVIAFLLLFALCYAAYLLCRGRSSSFALVVVLLCAFLCGLTLVLVYPITAADIFEYIAYARILVQHGANPHVFRPADFPGDPFMRYSAWPHIASPYGPLWTYVSGALGLLGGSSLLTYLLLFKGLALAVHLANSGLIYATLARWRPSYALGGTLLYAWNPLVLFESAAGGHNDGFAVFFVLLAVYLFVRGRFALALPAAALSCVVKMPMAVVVPLFAVGAWRALSGKTNRVRVVTLGLALAAALVLLLHAPLWEGWRSVGWLAREDLFTSSFAAVAVLALRQLVKDVELVRGLVRYAVLGLFGLFYVWQLARGRGDVPGFVEDLYWTVFVFLSIAVLWFQPWYLVWLVALGALVPSLSIGRLTTLFSYTATWNYVVFTFLLMWYYPQMTAGKWLVANMAAVLLVFGLPVACALYLIARGRSLNQLEGQPGTSGIDGRPAGRQL